MENIVMALVMVLQLLLSGGGAIGEQSNNMSWLQLMALLGSNNTYTNWYQDDWYEVDKTIDLGGGQWEEFGYGQGSTVRVHGNLRNGLYFDFSVQGMKYNSQHQVTNPVDGVTITQEIYSSGDSGYTFSVGPINFQTALSLWNMATSQMAS